MTPEEFYSLVPRERLRETALRSATPGYVWFKSIIERQVTRLRSSLGTRFTLHYAMKANPHSEILRLMRELGLGVDVASGGELVAAMAAGFDADNIEFSGPGKTAEELTLAVDRAIGSINVESLAELEVICQLSAQRSVPMRVGLRVNPATNARAGLRMVGATQFGLSELDIGPALERIKRAPGVTFVGLHVHVGSQILEAAAVLDIYRTCFELARSIVKHTGQPLQKLNFGGGWGVTYFAGQQPLDLENLGRGLADLQSDPAYATATEGTRLIVEPGRYLVAEAGVYITSVLYRKKAGHMDFAIVDGGMHHNYLLAGGMGQVIRRNFYVDALRRQGAKADATGTRLTVAGCLCTPQDVLAQNVELGLDVGPGDRLVFFNCGAYAATASPLAFLSHALPSEVLAP